MQKFDFHTEVCLGYHCCGGGEYLDVDGSFSLEDADVNALVQLVRDNDGETDVELLELETALPHVYETISEAHADAVSQATRNYWILQGCRNDDIEMFDDAMEELESEGLFKFEPDLAALREQLGLDDDEELSDDDIEDAKLEAFDEWKKEYFDLLSEEDKLDFAMSYYYVDGYCDDDNVYEYEMEIPEEIALLAEAEE